MRKKSAPSSALEAALWKKRKYKHFDSPLTPYECRRLVQNPEAVRAHAFYPFIRLDIVRPRIKRTASGRIKKSNKVRDIRYAAHADAAIYAYYNYVLSEWYEAALRRADLHDNVIAFRSLGKSSVDFAQEAFAWISTNTPCTALGIDVKDFFGSLDHALLKQRWAELAGADVLPPDHYAVYRSLTKHASVDLIAARKELGLSRSALDKKDNLCEASEFRDVIRAAGLVRVNKSQKGIPQGSPMSALLSNMYMLPFDAALKKAVSQRGGYYRRYCDDILVVVKPQYVVDVKAIIEESLAELQLATQPTKTLECDFAPFAARPLQYLGLVFDGKRTLLRSSGVARYYTKMRAGVKQHKDAKVRDGNTPLLVQRRKRLLRQYTEHAPANHRSYLNYVNRVALATGSSAIKKQVRKHRRRFKTLVEP